MTLVRPVTYAANGEKSSPKFACAFANGCKGVATAQDELQPGPVALFGSPSRQPLLNQAKAEGRDWYYGDHGVFRRFRYYRVTRNAYQYVGAPSRDRRRWDDLHIETQSEWRKGDSVVICPNSPVYMSWFGIDAQQWASKLAAYVIETTGRPVTVRWKANAMARPLYRDLEDAHLVVVFSSAAAVEALAAGVPVCTLAPWASTARMGITDIKDVETPVYPKMRDRDEFLFALANNQWTLDELADGMAWRWFLEGKNR